MLNNAKEKRLTETNSGLPDVGASIRAFFQKISVGIVTQEVFQGKTRNRVNYTDTMGVKQPFTAEQLSLKPEGARSWKWFTFHCEPNFIANTHDIIRIADVNYRIMAKNDYQEYGYIEYQVVEDYRPETKS